MEISSSHGLGLVHQGQDAVVLGLVALQPALGVEVLVGHVLLVDGGFLHDAHALALAQEGVQGIGGNAHRQAEAAAVAVFAGLQGRSAGVLGGDVAAKLLHQGGDGVSILVEAVAMDVDLRGADDLQPYSSPVDWAWELLEVTASPSPRRYRAWRCPR